MQKSESSASFKYTTVVMMGTDVIFFAFFNSLHSFSAPPPMGAKDKILLDTSLSMPPVISDAIIQVFAAYFTD